MQIHEYEEELKNNVEEFFKYWNEQVKAKPNDFPTEMDAGDWDDQFQAWLQTKEE